MNGYTCDRCGQDVRVVHSPELNLVCGCEEPEPKPRDGLIFKIGRTVLPAIIGGLLVATAVGIVGVLR